MIDDSFILWGCILGIACFFTISIIVLICWLSGWPIIMESIEQTLLVFSIPIIEFASSVICFIGAGIKRLRR